MNHRLKLVPPIFSVLFLLAGSLTGEGQPAPAATLDSLILAAQHAQAAGDFTAALNAWKQALKLRPDVPELWANLGLMQHDSGDIASAISSFAEANRSNPSLYVPNLFLGIDYVRTGKAKEAIPLLIKAEKINKTDPQAALALGRAYLAVNKFSAAAGELVRATRLDPKLGPAWFTLGIAHLDQVEADARTLSAQGKDSPFAGALYAESLQKQARFGEAATLYKTLLEAHPQPPCLRSNLGFALLREHDPAGASTAFVDERTAHPECGLALLGQARMALDAGNNQQAVGLLNELWARDHRFVETNAAVLFEGLAIEKTSDIVDVISHQTGISISNDLANALFMSVSGQGAASEIATRDLDVAASRTSSQDRRSADDHYAAGEFEICARQLESTFAALRADQFRLLAACAFFTGDDQLTARAAIALENQQPHSLEALYWSIQANERLALESLARFQKLEPDSARSHVLLGDIYHQLERHDDAQGEYLKALSMAPGDPAAMLGLASAYLSNNNNDGAIKIAHAALAGSPDDPELNLIAGEALLAKYDYAGAEPYLLKSLKAKPQMVPHVHALIGKVYAETGRTQEAIEQLKLGASSDEDGAIQYLLARMYRKLGDTKDANEALDRMKIIKQQRRERGVKRVEDPDLSSLEVSGGGTSTP